MTPNIELMRSAKSALRGSWGTAAIVTLIMMLIVGASAFVFIGPILLTGPLTLGYIFFLKRVRSDRPNATVDVLFSGFNDFLRAFLAYLLVMVYTILWSLLLVIPGLIMSYAYSMTFMILAEDKEISASDAIRKSREMMRGYKWKLFCLQLRFLGWLILCGLTFGILLFWVQPYMQMAVINFYEDVKADYLSRNGARVVPGVAL